MLFEIHLALEAVILHCLYTYRQVTKFELYEYQNKQNTLNALKEKKSPFLRLVTEHRINLMLTDSVHNSYQLHPSDLLSTKTAILY